MPEISKELRKEADKTKKNALKEAGKSPIVSLIYLKDDSTLAYHIGRTDLRNSLRMIQAHRELADNLEKGLMKTASLTKVRLTEMYRMVEDDTDTRKERNLVQLVKEETPNE